MRLISDNLDIQAKLLILSTFQHKYVCVFYFEKIASSLPVLLARDNINPGHEL
jgi:hypothetical protein